MTWISRLLPDQSGLRRRTNRNDKDRMASAQRHRRKPTLEAMEQRLVLAGGITIPPIAILGGPLTIYGDTNGDTIPIHVNSASAGGTVSVGPTFINGSFQTFTTLGAVTSINICLPGGGNNTTNTITITGPGKNLPTDLVQNTALGSTPLPSTSFPSIPPLPSTTLGAVTSINICLPGGGNNTTNTITITGPGKNLPTDLVQNTALGEDASAINIISPCNLTTGLPVPPTTSPYPLVHNLNLTITGVNASGALNVEELARDGTTNGGTLNATVRDSVFSTLEIEQTGCCPAAVTLAGVRVPGTVEVYEGYANGDSITLMNGATGPDVFGSTTLQQWTPMRRW